jgi:hypothetical protein
MPPSSRKTPSPINTPDALLAAWRDCPRDRHGERDVSDRFVASALSLLEEGRLQETIDGIIQSGRVHDFNDGIDLNFHAQSLSAMASFVPDEERASFPASPPGHSFDEYHLVALSWTGHASAFGQFDQREFRQQLGHAVDLHFKGLLAAHSKDGMTPSFSLRMPSVAPHPAVVAALPSDDKFRLIQDLFDMEGEPEGFQALMALQEEMMGDSETPESPDEVVISERLVLIGVAFDSRDFADDFVFAHALHDAAGTPDSWAGATLAPEHTFFMPPLALNGALVDSLCSHLKSQLFLSLQDQLDDGEEVYVDDFRMAYDPHHHLMTVSAFVGEDEVMETDVPVEWFYAGGVSSPDILRHLLDGSDIDVDGDGPLVATGKDGDIDEIDRQIEQTLPSLFRVPGSSRIH